MHALRFRGHLVRPLAVRPEARRCQRVGATMNLSKRGEC